VNSDSTFARLPIDTPSIPPEGQTSRAVFLVGPTGPPQDRLAKESDKRPPHDGLKNRASRAGLGAMPVVGLRRKTYDRPRKLFVSQTSRHDIPPAGRGRPAI
jgi:hypothetical protein